MSRHTIRNKITCQQKKHRYKVRLGESLIQAKIADNVSTLTAAKPFTSLFYLQLSIGLFNNRLLQITIFRMFIVDKAKSPQAEIV